MKPKINNNKNRKWLPNRTLLLKQIKKPATSHSSLCEQTKVAREDKKKCNNKNSKITSH